MAGTSKILTVSYGTFSCTLEGFDDPVTTMRGIAEYFRDLSAGDRYFGAEPPVPDARRLQSIAEQASRDKVTARTGKGGIVLSAAEPVATETTMPSQDGPTEAGTEAVSKLQRLREAVARTGSMENAFGAEGEKPNFMRAPAELLQDEVTEDWAEEPQADVAMNELAAEEVEVEAEELVQSAEVADVADASDDTVIALTEAEDEVEAAAEVEAEAEMAEAEALEIHPDDVGLDEFDMDAVEVVAETADAEAFDDDAFDEIVETTEDEAPAGPMILDTAAEITAEVVAPAAPVAPPAPMPEPESEVDLAAQASTEPAGGGSSLLSRLGRKFAGANSSSADARAAFEGMKALADPAARAAALEEGKRLGLQSETPEEIDDLDAPIPAAGALPEIDPEILADAELAETLWQDDEPVIVESTLDLTGADVVADDAGDAPVEAPLAARALQEEPESVNRILAQTNSELENVDGTRRRETIAQLKAAVAATRADRDDEDSDEDEAEISRFREDFERAVRPPVATETAVQAQRRLAPLMLVSEQRIDTPDNGAMPRRVAGNLALAEDDMDEEEMLAFNEAAFADSTPFIEYAAAHDAVELQDMIEAAGAYCVYVLGQPYFTRSQLMTMVERAAGDDVYNREAGLRAFGTLMRLGHVQKVRRGLFSMSANSRFQTASVL